MFGFKKEIKKEDFWVDWQGNKIKLSIHHEHRKDSRVALSKTGIRIRLPLLLPEFEKKQLIHKFIAWAKERLDEKPHFHFDKFKKYNNLDELHLFDETFILNIQKTKVQKSFLSLKKGALVLVIDESLADNAIHPTISALLYKFIAKKYKPLVWMWLNDLNQKHQFGDLKSMKMKNNSSNWGSCSNKGNINISARLLLAPKEVVEYVLIHELAHLKEQNHGLNFWNLVAKACPSYEQHEKWLKNNAKHCVI